MKSYYIEFRVITRENYFTPQCCIPVENIHINLKEDAEKLDAQMALSKEFEELGYKPDEFKIENMYKAT